MSKVIALASMVWLSGCTGEVSRRVAVLNAAAATSATLVPSSARGALAASTLPPQQPSTMFAVVAVVQPPSTFDAWLNKDYARAQAMPPCLRSIVCRCEAGRDSMALVLSLHTATDWDGVRAFYTQSDASTTAEHVHFWQPSILRVPTGPCSFGSAAVTTLLGDKLSPGQGLFFGAHGLTVGFKLWASKFTSEAADEEHSRMGVVSSIVGELLPGSTDAPLPGPAVVHITRTPSEAKDLAAQLSTGQGGDPRVKQALDLGVIKAPLYAVSGEVVRDDHHERDQPV